MKNLMKDPMSLFQLYLNFNRFAFKWIGIIVVVFAVLNLVPSIFSALFALFQVLYVVVIDLLSGGGGKWPAFPLYSLFLGSKFLIFCGGLIFAYYCKVVFKTLDDFIKPFNELVESEVEDKEFKEETFRPCEEGLFLLFKFNIAFFLLERLSLDLSSSSNKYAEWFSEAIFGIFDFMTMCFGGVMPIVYIVMLRVWFVIFSRNNELEKSLNEII